MTDETRDTLEYITKMTAVLRQLNDEEEAALPSAKVLEFKLRPA